MKRIHRACCLSILLLLIWLFPEQIHGQKNQIQLKAISSFPLKMNAMNIPELLEDMDPDPQVGNFYIDVISSQHSFFDGSYTKTYGYNQEYLGPVIRVKRGQRVKVHAANLLNEPTTIHWHGLEVEGEMDGGPFYPIPQGERWLIDFIIDQPASTLWFHPHPHGRIGEQVYRGLAGIFIIEDEVSENLDIPKEYGVNDFPILIQDKRFDPHAQLVYLTDMMDLMHGMLGEIPTVNGSVNPFLEVRAEQIRLRLINGSNSRIYQLEFSNRKSFNIIASDGGFLEEPVEMKSLTLSPGERAEILLDLSQEQIGNTFSLRSPEFDILQFVISTKGKGYRPLPDKLTEIKWLSPDSSKKQRLFILSGMGPNVSINNLQFDPSRIDEIVREGDIEIWEVRNEMIHHGSMRGNFMGRMMRRGGMGMMMAHPFHVHGIQFQILDRNGISPEPHEKGWKDTVLVYPGERVRFIAKFRKTGKFVYHCHILEHDDLGMMGTFKVQ